MIFTQQIVEDAREFVVRSADVAYGERNMKKVERMGGQHGRTNRKLIGEYIETYVAKRQEVLDRNAQYTPELLRSIDKSVNVQDELIAARKQVVALEHHVAACMSRTQEILGGVAEQERRADFITQVAKDCLHANPEMSVDAFENALAERLRTTGFGKVSWSAVSAAVTAALTAG